MTVRRTVLLSDFHLGTNPLLDDFTHDAEFAALLALPEFRPETDTELSLVLLGDTFDLWQAVSPQECNSEDAAQVVLEYDAASEGRRFEEIRARHADWFAALGQLAHRPRCRVVIVSGNHDHSLIHPDLQARAAAGLGLPTSRVTFAPCYDEPALGLYADHGSQYDHHNAYARYNEFSWTTDCAGYYFVKLFLNRLEARDPRIDNAPGGWGSVWHWLRRTCNFSLLARAITCFNQYWTDDRVPRRIGLLGARRRGAGAWPAPGLLANPAAPVRLVRGPAARTADRFFSDDPEMEEFLRAAYAASAEVRAAVNEILDGRTRRRGIRVRRRGPARRGRVSSAPRPEVPKPRGKARRASRSASREAGDLLPIAPTDSVWASRLFSAAPFRDAPLSPANCKFVVFGHTHKALVHPLATGATYLNTGTWASAEGAKPLVIVEASDGPAVARLCRFEQGRLA